MTRTVANVMTGAALPSPFLSALREALERLADGPLAPRLDVYAARDAIIANVAVPDVDPTSLDICVGSDFVTISGSMREERPADGTAYLHRELDRGSFSRSFRLPVEVAPEAASASLKDGLLTLTLPQSDHPTLKRVKVEVA